MGATILRNATLHITSEEFEGEDCLAVQDHRIIPMDPILLEDGTSEEIELNGMHVCPGFIDLLVNGCCGVAFGNDPSVETLEQMRRWETIHGTTTFVPTLISGPRELMTRALSSVSEFKEKHPGVCPGVHLEGPFINSLHKGFQPSGFMRSLNDGDLEYLKENRDAIAYMTIAPECVKPKYIIDLLSARIKLSLGHTACTFYEANSAFRAGVNSVTHLYNGMKSMQGREPGVIGALLSSEHVFASIIPDGRHVHPAIIKFLNHIIGDRMYIVSDSQSIAGMQKSPSSFQISGNELFVDPRRGIIDAKGSLAGTDICMMDGVRYLVENCGYSLDDALAAATIIPASFLGLKDMGRIEGGYLADLIVFDDDFKIRYVIQNGFLKNSSELI